QANAGSGGRRKARTWLNDGPGCPCKHKRGPSASPIRVRDPLAPFLVELPAHPSLLVHAKEQPSYHAPGILTTVLAMPVFLIEFLGRIAVMLPVILILVLVLWLIFNKRRHDTFAPAFSPSDMRTWSLRFALVDGVVFAVTFALLSAWMADSQF